MMNLQKIGIITMMLIVVNNNVKGQGMAVNSSGAAADASAMLDVSSTSQGVLVPRMTASQRTGISSPATGLLVYQTDGTPGFYYFNGSVWTSLSGGAPTGAAGGNLGGTYPNPSIASLPAISGANLTNLNASNLSSGTVGTARLGSGSASSSTFLRGDGTWATPSGGGSSASDVVLVSASCGSDNTISVPNGTTNRFYVVNFGGCNVTNPGTKVSVTLPNPSSLPEGTEIKFSAIRNGDYTSPQFRVATPSGTIYTIYELLIIGSTMTHIGNGYYYSFVTNGTNTWYQLR